jgi:hypothetical protein
MTTTNWAEKGATVAEYRSYTNAAYVNFTTVNRVTATQVVCASGNRYRRDDSDTAAVNGLRPVGGGEDWLLPPDHRSVVNAVAANTLAELRRTLNELLGGYRRDVDAALATLDEVAAAVAAARTTITEGLR